MNPKIRYIDLLVKVKDKFNRISKISEVASQEIEKAKKFKTKKYAYLDFTF